MESKTQKFRGVVDRNKITTQTSKKTGNPFHAAIIGGMEFTFFDDALKEGLIQFDGLEVTGEYRTNGKYNNLISAEPAKAQEPRRPAASESVLRINSMCLSYAKDLVVAGKIELKGMYKQAKEMRVFIETGEAELDFKNTGKKTDGAIA